MRKTEHIKQLFNDYKSEFADDFDNIILGTNKNLDEKKRDEEQIKTMIDYTRKKLGQDFFITQREHINKERH